MNDTIWELISPIDLHLDEHVAQIYKDQPLAQDWGRVAKVIEENGEAIAALIAYTGQNPRKGTSGSQQDLLDELADTALTAILAIQHFTKDSERTKNIVEQKCKKISNRFIEWESNV